MNMRHWVRGSVAVALAGLLLSGLSCGKQTSSSTQAENAAATDSIRLLQHIQMGHQAFLSSCAMCHGPSGEGNGPLAGELAKESGTGPANLNDRTLVERLGRRGIIDIITRGGAHTGRSNLMPPWGERMSESQISDITDFLIAQPSLNPGIPKATIADYMKAPAGVPEEGRKLFVFYCTACHGPQARGNGIYADTVFARSGLRPRDLTDSLYLAKQTDQDLYATIALGGGHRGKSSYMPEWAITLTPAQIKELLSYVRVISRTASKPS